jgi:hypothetical protein
MDLKTYLKSLDDEDARAAFAQRCETTLGHMRNCMYVEGKRLAPDVCVLVERHSDKKVTRQELRPDDWHRIWPELVTADHPAPKPAPEPQAQ